MWSLASASADAVVEDVGRRGRRRRRPSAGERRRARRASSSAAELLLGELGQAADACRPPRRGSGGRPGCCGRSGRMSATRVRIRMPPVVVSITSSASVTLAIATTGPLRSLVLMSIRPLPPRFCERYSVSGGPLAVAVGADGQEAGRVVVAVGHDHADDLVALLQVDPLDAVGRAGPSSGRRTRRTGSPCPRRVLRITWSPALVRATPMSWSPSSRPRAMIPRPSGRLNAVSSVFLTVPRRVTISRHSSSRNSRTGIRPVIFSPSAELQQVDDRPAARGPGRHRQVVDLQPVDLAVVGEEEDVVVRQGDEHVLEEVAFAWCWWR